MYDSVLVLPLLKILCCRTNIFSRNGRITFANQGFSYIQSDGHQDFAQLRIMIDLSNSLKHDKYILVIEGFDCLKSSSGTCKIVRSHALLFRERGYDFVRIFPLNISYRIGRTLTSIYGLTVNGKREGFIGLNNLKFSLAKAERKGKSLAGILIHHAIFNRLEALGSFLHAFPETKKIFYLHDYWTCCLSVNMQRCETENFWCHSDLKSGCDGCIWKERNNLHRKRVKDFFKQIENCEFIAPSESLMREWKLRTPVEGGRVRIIGHLKAPSFDALREESKSSHVRVAFIGTPSVNKGWNEFGYLVRYFSEKTIELYHIGHTNIRLRGVKNIDIEIHKQGLNAMTDAIRDNRIDVALLLSKCHETYSYTLYESLQAKALICCFEDSGNIGAVVRETGLGWCFKDKEAMLKFLDSKALLAEVRKKQRTAKFPQTMVTNDEVISCFDGVTTSVGREALSTQYSRLEAVKASLTAASIGCLNQMKALVKLLVEKF